MLMLPCLCDCRNSPMVIILASFRSSRWWKLSYRHCCSRTMFGRYCVALRLGSCGCTSKYGWNCTSWDLASYIHDYIYIYAFAKGMRLTLLRCEHFGHSKHVYHSGAWFQWRFQTRASLGIARGQLWLLLMKTVTAALLHMSPAWVTWQFWKCQCLVPLVFECKKQQYLSCISAHESATEF